MDREPGRREVLEVLESSVLRRGDMEEGIKGWLPMVPMLGFSVKKVTR